MKNKFIIVLMIVVLLFVFRNRNIFQDIIYNVDSQHGINVIDQFSKNFFTWNEDYNGGSNNSLFTIPTTIVGSLLNLLNTSLSNYLVLTILALLLWYVSYKITSEILDSYYKNIDAKYKTAIFFLSSYILSNEIIRGYFISNNMIIWSLLFSGLGILFFLKYLKNNKLIYCIFSVLSILFTSLSFHSLILSVMFCYIYWLIYDFVLDSERKSIVKKISPILVFSILFLLTNAYWITNTLSDLISHNGALTTFTAVKANTDGVLNYTNTYDNILPLNTIFSTPSNYDLYPRYISLFLIVSSYVIIGLAYLSLFFAAKEKNQGIKRALLSFWFIFIIFFYFALGPKGPGGVFMFLWRYLPGFQIFRNFFKFEWLIVLILPILLSYTVLNLFQKNKKIIKILITAIVTVSILRLLPYVYLQKELSPISIPQSYQDLYNYLDSVGNKDKILIAPVFSWTQKFKWSNQYQRVADPLAISFLNNPIYANRGVYQLSKAESTNIKLIHDLVENGACFRYLAGIRSIGLVVIRSDIAENFAKQANISTPDVLYDNNIEDKISEDSGLHHIKTFGDLSLYGLDEKYLYPMVFSESDSDLLINENYCLENNTDHTSKNFQPTSKTTQKNTAPNIQISPPIEFFKVSPTMYEINIKNITNDFNIILNQAFNDGWIIETNNNISLKSSTKHFIANGFANGWKLNVNDLCKIDKTCQFNKDGSIDVSLKIEFLPQRIFNLGIAITVISILLCLLFLLYSQKIKTSK